MTISEGSRVRMEREWCDLVGVPCFGGEVTEWRGVVVELSGDSAWVEWDHGDLRRPAVRYLEADE